MNTVLLYKNTCEELSQSKLSNHALTTYVALRSLANIHNKTTVISIESIGYQLKGTLELNHKEVANIKKALQELNNGEYIDILSIRGKLYEIDMSNLIEEIESKDTRASGNGNAAYIKPKNTYAIFQLEDIRKLYTQYGASVFKYFFYILGELEMYWINYNRETLSIASGFDVRTVDKYNDALVNCKILYIHKYNCQYSDSGKTLNNLYGLYANREKIIADAEKYAETTKGVKGFNNNGEAINVTKQEIKRGFGSKASSSADCPF